MSRIRTIKPEFPHSESMGRVSREARLLFILLWTLADDAGRLRGNSRILASLLYPYDDDAKDLMDDWLAALETEGCIARYLSDGSTYLQICAWCKHQKIDRPSASKLPGPDAHSRINSTPREDSRSVVGGSGSGSGSGSGPVRDGRGAEAVEIHSVPAEQNGASQSEIEATQSMTVIKAKYPSVSGRVDWITGEKSARNLVHSDGVTWQQLIEGTILYGAYIDATRAYAMNPAKFFGAADRPWSQAWAIPERQRRKSKYDQAMENLRD